MAVDPLIVAVFGPAPVGLDLSGDRRPGDNAAVIVLIAIATIAVALRIVVRFMQQSSFKADDYVIMLALLFDYATAGLTFGGSKFGAGKHVWATKLTDVTTIMKILFSYTFVYAATASATKISILLFYYRIFSRAGLSFHIMLGISGFLAISYSIIIWVTMGNCCTPVSFYWNQFSGATGKCIDVNQFFLALGIINMLIDIIILAVPIHQIWKLNMSARNKFAVSGIMMLGSFVCVASIVRIYYLSVFTKSTDITWLMGPVFIWSSVEPSIGILSACLPNLRPLFTFFQAKMSSIGESSERYPNASNSKNAVWDRSGRVRSKGKSFGLSKEDDEVQLTNLAIGGSGTSDEDVRHHGIMVTSNIKQSSTSSS